MALRLAFMGTPDFAVPSLAALLSAGHEVAAVYTRPPQPAGRGHKLQLSAVHRFAEARALPVRTPRSLKDPDIQAQFSALALDIAVVAAYGLLLPKPVLVAPRLGCVNVHASLLPRWRGAAPIARAIMAGDRETGVTIMQMDEGLDTGAMLLWEAIAIAERETAGSLHDRLAALGAKLVVRALEGLEQQTLKAVPQPAEGVTYAAKLTKDEARLDWSKDAIVLERQVRGLAPHPGAWCFIGAQRVKVLDAFCVMAAGVPGLVLDAELTVACGKGALRLTRLQREGKAPLSADAFLRGHPVESGTRLS